MMRQLLFKWCIGLYLLIGAYDLSAQVVTEANQTEDKRIENRLDEVIQAFNDGEYDGKKVETLIELSDQAFEITMARLEKQRKLQPTAPYWAYYLGVIHEHAKLYRQAIPYYEESFALDYDAADAFRLAVCYERIGLYEKGLQYCEQAISLDNEEPQYLHLKAWLLDYTGQTEEAIVAMSDYISQVPDRTSAYYARGWFEEHSGKAAEAIEDFSICIRLAPEYAYAYLNRGVIYMRAGEWESAEEDFRKVIALETEPEKAECAFYAYYYLGDKETAITWLNKVLEQGDEGDYYDAACLYAEMGEPKKALNYLRESLQRGYRRFAHIRRDRMLDNIRNLPAFEKLLKEYEAIHAEEVKLSYVSPSGEFSLRSIDGSLTMQ
ncbi:MAG: tetratricopeptide repeat protein [Parabacteroides sp.]